MSGDGSVGAAILQAALFVGVNALVLYVALLASWRLLPTAPGSARLTAAGTIAVGVIVLIVEALGTAGVYTRVAVLVVTVLLASVARLRWSGVAHPGDDLRAAARWSGSMSGWGRVLGVVALAAWLRAAWVAVTTLPLGWDSLTYHLPFAATWVQSGRLAAIDGPLSMDHYAHFPKNAEMLASWFMLPFHGDVLVGLMNTLLLAFAWVAVYALARALAVCAADSSLMATSVATSPFLYSFTWSENADVLVFALSIATVLFLVRWLETDARADALCAVGAAGLAMGAKYTALTLTGSVLVVLAVVGLARLSRRRQIGRMWRACAVAAIILIACGGRQYVSNAVSTGNPVYPLVPSVAGRNLLSGSPYTAWLTSELGSGSRSDDRFAFSGMFHYYPGWKTPTSAGPKYLGLIAMALLALLGPFAPPRRSDHGAPEGARLHDQRVAADHSDVAAHLQVRRDDQRDVAADHSDVAAHLQVRRDDQRDVAAHLQVRLVVGLAVLVLAAALLPATGLPALSRRFWPGSTARLVGAAFGLFAVAAASVPARLRSWPGQALRGLLLLFIAWDLVAARALLRPDAPLAVAVLAAMLIVAAATRTPGMTSRRRPWVAVLLVLLAMVPAIAALDRYRSTLSWAGATSTVDIDSAPLDYLGGWSALETAAPLRVALVTDNTRRGQNRFLYPLFGRRLQHHVSYVPVNASAAPGSPAFVLEQDPREDDWLQALAAQQIDRVVVQAPWPMEDGWMHDRPERFTLLLDDPSVRIYVVGRR